MTVIDKKRCTRCNQMLPLDSYYTSERTLKSGETKRYPRGMCKDCDHARVERFKEQKKAEGTWINYVRRQRENIKADPERHERKKRQQREYSASYRRRVLGQKPRGNWKRYRENGKGGKLDLGPFSEWLAEQVKLLGIDKVVTITDTDEKQIRRWTSQQDKGETVQSISVDAADRIFTALDATDQMAVLYPIDNS